MHGDAKHRNCLWHQGHLAGLLDWEMAHVGDPLTDLGYLISFFNTGRRALNLHRHEALAMCKIATIVSRGIVLLHDGLSRDERFEAWETLMPQYLTTIRRRLDSADAR